MCFKEATRASGLSDFWFAARFAFRLACNTTNNKKDRQRQQQQQ